MFILSIGEIVKLCVNDIYFWGEEAIDVETSRAEVLRRMWDDWIAEGYPLSAEIGGGTKKKPLRMSKWLKIVIGRYPWLELNKIHTLNS
jgi:hypothetical protein